MTDQEGDRRDEGAPREPGAPPDAEPFAALDEPAPPPAPSPFAGISLSARQLVAGSFDLMAKSERELRHTSFYLGFLALVTIGPAIALFWAYVVRFGVDEFDVERFRQIGADTPEAGGWLALSILIAAAGLIVVLIESQTTSIAVLGSRLHGQPLSVSGAVMLARRRFWPVLIATILVGILSAIVQQVLGLFYDETDVAQAQVWLVPQLLVAIAVQTPFIYAAAGIVLGEVGVLESLRRSVRLFRARPALAFTVALFGAATQLLLFFGLEIGLDVVIRIAEVTGVGTGGIAVFLGTIIGSALTFAFGTLAFTAAALAAAPQVIGFLGLTHYTGGLDAARAPVVSRRPWDPFISTGLWVAIVLGLLSLVLGIAALA